jgi:hypothetical protein
VLAEFGLPILPCTAAKLLALDQDPGKYLGPTAGGGAEIDYPGDILKEVELCAMSVDWLC